MKLKQLHYPENILTLNVITFAQMHVFVCLCMCVRASIDISLTHTSSMYSLGRGAPADT